MTDTGSLWFRVLSARYGMESGRLKGEALRLPSGGVIFIFYVGLGSLVTMSYAPLVMGSIHYYGRMFGVAWFLLELGLVGYMNYRCLKNCLFLI